MSGKEAIIDKIILSSQERAKAIIDEATEDARLMVEEVNAKVNLELQRVETQASQQGDEIFKRKATVAELEVKKYNLMLKQQLLTRAFEEAAKSVLKMNDKDYLKVIEKLLKKYAEKDEQVIVCKTDSKRITQQFLDSVCPKLQLKLSDKYGDFEGGLVLSKGTYDKNLTLEVVLGLARENSESAVAKILFGGK